MSEPTPHPDQPTPHPAEGGHGTTSEPSTGATAAGEYGDPAPAAEPHAGDGHGGYAGDGTTPPPAGPPPGKKPGRGLLIPLIAAALVLVLVAGGLAAFFLLRDSSHKIVTPASAGGMKRDTATEGKLKTQLADAEKQFKAQDKSIHTTASAIYTQSDTKRGPKGGLVFLGGRLKESDGKGGATFLSTVRKQATSSGFKVTNVDVGDGAKGVCAAQAQGDQKIAICAWATDDTRGELLPTVSGWETPTLSKVMKSLRQDVEVSG